MEGGRYVLLIHAEVPQEEDAESDVYPVPTDAASSGASNDGGIPLGDFGHDVFDTSTDS